MLPRMSPNVLDSKTILFYSTRPPKELSYKNHIESLEFQFDSKDTIEDFFQDRTNHTQVCCSLLDLENHNDLLTQYLNNFNPTLAPLFLVSHQPFESKESHFSQLADDYIAAPLTVEVFQKLSLFWLNQKPLFDPLAFKKLLQMNDDDFTKKILNSFNESLTKVYEKSLAAIKEDDLLEMAKACHSIKASAKMLGAQDLFHVCQWVEFKKNQTTPISQCFKLHFQKRLSETLNCFLKLSQTPLDKIIS